MEPRYILMVSKYLISCNKFIISLLGAFCEDDFDERRDNRCAEAADEREEWEDEILVAENDEADRVRREGGARVTDVRRVVL